MNTWACLPVLVTLVAAPVWAQSQVTGSLSGRVVDPKGAPIRGAKVELEHPNSGVRRTLFCDEQGAWRSPWLPLGEWKVLVSQAGYASVKTTKTLEISRNYRFQPRPITSNLVVLIPAKGK